MFTNGTLKTVPWHIPVIVPRAWVLYLDVPKTQTSVMHVQCVIEPITRNHVSNLNTFF